MRGEIGIKDVQGFVFICHFDRPKWRKGAAFPKGPASKGGEQSEAILARSDKTPTVALDPTSRGVCTVVMYFPCGKTAFGCPVLLGVQCLHPC